MERKYHITGLLLAAFLVWLAHSMVPHHHHGREICFNTHHCQESACETGSSSAGMCQKHDHQDEDAGCILKQITFLPAHHNKVVFIQVQVYTDLGLIFNPDLENPDPGSEGQPWRYLTGPPPPLSIPFNTSCGLRAPPVV